MTIRQDHAPPNTEYLDALNKDFTGALPTNMSLRELGSTWAELRENIASQTATITEKIKRVAAQNVALENVLTWPDYNTRPYINVRNLQIEEQQTTNGGEDSIFRLPSFQEGSDIYSVSLHTYRKPKDPDYPSRGMSNVIDFYLETISKDGNVISIERASGEYIDESSEVNITDSSYLPKTWRDNLNGDPTKVNAANLDAVDEHLAFVERLRSLTANAIHEARTQPDKRNIRAFVLSPPTNSETPPDYDTFGVHTADASLTVQANETFEKLHRAASIIGPVAFRFIVPKTVPPIVLEGVMRAPDSTTHTISEGTSTQKRMFSRRPSQAPTTANMPKAISFQSRVLYENPALGTPDEQFIKEIGPLYQQLFEDIDLGQFMAKTGKEGSVAAIAVKQALEKVYKNKV